MPNKLYVTTVCAYFPYKFLSCFAFKNNLIHKLLFTKLFLAEF